MAHADGCFGELPASRTCCGQASRQQSQIMKLPYRSSIAIIGFCSTLFAASAIAQSSVGAAPKGDAKVVASRIIKHNFPSCGTVSHAVRAPDGSIRARCDTSNYMVFTIFNAKEGKTSEIALNCTAAKKLLNIDC